jgi:hypothetical protein
MNLPRAALFALISVASTGFAIAQTPPSQDTSPSSASSPAQRDSTSTPATEAPATNGTNPAAASTPHQQEATKGTMAGGMDKAKHDKMLKDCVTKERAKDSSLSKDDAKKTCMDQMKMSSSDQSKSYQK